MAALASLIVLPLAMICVQLALGLTGAAGYVPYKICLLITPILYCRQTGIRLPSDILRFGNWRNRLPLAIGLGVLTASLFFAADYLLAGLLVDKAAIAAKLKPQFGVTARTVLLIAPFTILVNSLLEEFFYRGFAFGLLRRHNRWVARLLPAVIFTGQHILFIYHWFTPLPMLIAVSALLVFAAVLQEVYDRADTIVAPWIVHLCGDLAMMIIAVRMLSEPAA